MSDFEKLKEDFKNKLAKAQSFKEVNEIRAEIFGKKGFINSEFKKLGSLSPEDKKEVASKINNIKQELSIILNEKLVKASDSEKDQQVKKEKQQ